MLNFGKEQSNPHWVGKSATLIVGYKVMITLLFVFGLVRNEILLVSTIYTLPFVLAWSFSVTLTKNLAILAVVFLILISIMWITSFIVRLCDSKKRGLTTITLIIGNLFDCTALTISLLQGFSFYHLCGLIMNLGICCLLMAELSFQKESQHNT